MFLGLNPDVLDKLRQELIDKVSKSFVADFVKVKPPLVVMQRSLYVSSGRTGPGPPESEC